VRIAHRSTVKRSTSQTSFSRTTIPTGELPTKLRQNVVLIKDKVLSGTTVEDAETMARYARLTPHTNAFNDFVSDAAS
jgi:hypothetical protein